MRSALLIVDNGDLLAKRVSARLDSIASGLAICMGIRLEENNMERLPSVEILPAIFMMSRRARHWADIASKLAICMEDYNEKTGTIR